MSEPGTIERMEARLARQEKKLATTRAVLGLVLAIAVVGLAWRPGMGGGTAFRPAELRAQRFVLVDESGETAGLWAARAGASRLEMVAHRPDGNRSTREPGFRVEASASTGTSVTVTGERGLLRYTEGPAGPDLRMSSDGGELTLSCVEGSPYLGMLDGKGGQADFWPASLAVSGVLLAGGYEESPIGSGLHLWSGTPPRRLHLGVDAAGDPLLHALDADGNEIARYSLEPAR